MQLAGVLVRWVWQRVNQREGELPEGVALTCPASWGPHKISLFEQAVRANRIGEMTRLGRAELLSEPQAAAIGYGSREQVEVGARLAVYDLGGGTFDAAVVRKDSPTAFTLLGRPEGIDRLGGVTFDEMLFEHVCAAAGVPLTQIDPNDPHIVPEVARLRRECTEAKEALSVDTEATIPVALGGVRQRVRVTRAEFEEMIRPDLDRTIEALHRALQSAAVDGTQLDAILLVGGSSRIPLVSQLVSAEFGQAPAIDTDPKTTVAIGAARFLAPTPVPSKDSVDTDFQLPAVPPERPQMSTMLSSDEDSTAEPVPHRSRKAVLGGGPGSAARRRGGRAGCPETRRRAPSVRGGPGDDAECGHASSRPVGGLTGPKPHSTGGSGAGSTTSGPASSATSSAHGQGARPPAARRRYPGRRRARRPRPRRKAARQHPPPRRPHSPQSSSPTPTHTHRRRQRHRRRPRRRRRRHRRRRRRRHRRAAHPQCHKSPGIWACRRNRIPPGRSCPLVVRAGPCSRRYPGEIHTIHGSGVEVGRDRQPAILQVRLLRLGGAQLSAERGELLVIGRVGGQLGGQLRLPGR